MASKTKFHRKIVRVIKKIAKEAIKANIAGKGKVPLIQSENDLCCHIFKELYDTSRQYIFTTEWTNYGIGDKTHPRHDLAIYESAKSEYTKTKKGFYYQVVPTEYIALFEFKTLFDANVNKRLKGIISDLNLLKDANAKNKYVVFFDYRGVCDDSYFDKIRSEYGDSKITFIYADLKNKKYKIINL